MAKAAPIPTVPTMFKHSILFGVGAIAVGLAFYYAGDKPVLKQAKEGWNGTTKGWFK